MWEKASLRIEETKMKILIKITALLVFTIIAGIQTETAIDAKINLLLMLVSYIFLFGSEEGR